MSEAIEATFFPSAKAFRAWLRAESRSADFLWVGFHKVRRGKEVMTWPQSVDEALCFGWIDGIRKRIDDERYMIRFSRRRERGTWSAVNIKRIKELVALRRVTPAGRKAFEARRSNRSGIYSYEQRSAQLPEIYADVLARDAAATRFFEAQAPSYRKAAVWWVVGAKQEATQVRRLAQLINDSARGRRLKQFVSPTGTKKAPAPLKRAARRRG